MRATSGISSPGCLGTSSGAGAQLGPQATAVKATGPLGPPAIALRREPASERGDATAETRFTALPKPPALHFRESLQQPRRDRRPPATAPKAQLPILRQASSCSSPPLPPTPAPDSLYRLQRPPRLPGRAGTASDGPYGQSTAPQLDDTPRPRTPLAAVAPPGEPLSSLPAWSNVVRQLRGRAGFAAGPAGGPHPRRLSDPLSRPAAPVAQQQRRLSAPTPGEREPPPPLSAESPETAAPPSTRGLIRLTGPCQLFPAAPPLVVPPGNRTRGGDTAAAGSQLSSHYKRRLSAVNAPGPSAGGPSPELRCSPGSQPMGLRRVPSPANAKRAGDPRLLLGRRDLSQVAGGSSLDPIELARLWCLTGETVGVPATRQNSNHDRKPLPGRDDGNAASESSAETHSIRSSALSPFVSSRRSQQWLPQSQASILTFTMDPYLASLPSSASSSFVV